MHCCCICQVPQNVCVCFHLTWLINLVDCSLKLYNMGRIIHIIILSYKKGSQLNIHIKKAMTYVPHNKLNCYALSSSNAQCCSTLFYTRCCSNLTSSVSWTVISAVPLCFYLLGMSHLFLLLPIVSCKHEKILEVVSPDRKWLQGIPSKWTLDM